MDHSYGQYYFSYLVIECHVNDRPGGWGLRTNFQAEKNTPHVRIKQSDHGEPVFLTVRPKHQCNQFCPNFRLNSRYGCYRENLEYGRIETPGDYEEFFDRVEQAVFLRPVRSQRPRNVNILPLEWVFWRQVVAKRLNALRAVFWFFRDCPSLVAIQIANEMMISNNYLVALRRMYKLVPIARRCAIPSSILRSE